MTRRTGSMRTTGIRLVAGAAAAAALLAGCADDIPEPDPDPAATAPAPVLDEGRIDRILAEVQTTIEDGDAALDPDLLESRVAGPALEMRTAEYQLNEASDGGRELTPLTTDSQVEVVAATDEWPRSLYVVSHIPDGSNLPLLLVLNQRDARSQYKLWFWSSLLPGAETPTTARPDVGSDPVPEDADGLVASPLDAVSGYAELLADPDASVAEDFADDPFRESYRQKIDALSDTVEVAGKVTEDYDVVDGTTWAIASEDGGALVAGVIRARLTITKTVEGSTLDAGGDIALLMGKDTKIEEGVTAEYLVPVTLNVPPADSDEQIGVLGAEQVITQVTVGEPDEDESADDG